MKQRCVMYDRERWQRRRLKQWQQRGQPAPAETPQEIIERDFQEWRSRVKELYAQCGWKRTRERFMREREQDRKRAEYAGKQAAQGKVVVDAAARRQRRLEAEQRRAERRERKAAEQEQREAGKRVREAREQELALLGIHPVRYRSRGNNVFFLLRRAAGRRRGQ